MAEKSRIRVYDGFVKIEKVDVDGKHLLEVVVTTDSVAFLVHNVDTAEVLLVTQNRPAMIRPDNRDGTITEAAAGRFDKKIGIEGLILDELHQELGVVARVDQIRQLNDGEPLALSPGVLTERQYLAYVAVSDHQIDPTKRRYGDPAEGESIIRRFIPVQQLHSMSFADMKTFALVQWFLRTKMI